MPAPQPAQQFLYPSSAAETIKTESASEAQPCICNSYIHIAKLGQLHTHSKAMISILYLSGMPSAEKVYHRLAAAQLRCKST